MTKTMGFTISMLRFSQNVANPMLLNEGWIRSGLKISWPLVAPRSSWHSVLSASCSYTDFVVDRISAWFSGCSGTSKKTAIPGTREKVCILMSRSKERSSMLIERWMVNKCCIMVLIWVVKYGSLMQLPVVHFSPCL